MLQSNRTARSFSHIPYPVQVTLPSLRQSSSRHPPPSDRGSIAQWAKLWVLEADCLGSSLTSSMVYFWVIDFNSLCLSFLIYEMEVSVKLSEAVSRNIMHIWHLEDRVWHIIKALILFYLQILTPTILQGPPPPGSPLNCPPPYPMGGSRLLP